MISRSCQHSGECLVSSRATRLSACIYVIDRKEKLLA